MPILPQFVVDIAIVPPALRRLTRRLVRGNDSGERVALSRELAREESGGGFPFFRNGREYEVGCFSLDDNVRINFWLVGVCVAWRSATIFDCCVQVLREFLRICRRDFASDISLYSSVQFPPPLPVFVSFWF